MDETKKYTIGELTNIFYLFADDARLFTICYLLNCERNEASLLSIQEKYKEYANIFTNSIANLDIKNRLLPLEDAGILDCPSYNVYRLNDCIENYEWILDLIGDIDLGEPDQLNCAEGKKKIAITKRMGLIYFIVDRKNRVLGKAGTKAQAIEMATMIRQRKNKKRYGDDSEKFCI